jgi:hypothetical protein
MAIDIKERDIKIFSVLQDFPSGLPSTYICELVDPNKRLETTPDGREYVRYALRERIYRLADWGYLELVDDFAPKRSQGKRVGKNRPAVYRNTALAYEVLEEEGIPFSPAFKLTNKPYHDLGCCIVAASFRLGLMAVPGVVPVTADTLLAHPNCPPRVRDERDFNPPVEFMHHGTPVTMVKDHDWEPFGFEFNNGQYTQKVMFGGFEFDTAKMTIDRHTRLDETSIARHLLACLELVNGGYHKHYGIPRKVPIRVLFYTVKATHKRRIMDKLDKLTKGKGSPYIGFQSVPDFTRFDTFPPADGWALLRDYECVGHPPLNIVDVLGAQKEQAA